MKPIVFLKRPKTLLAIFAACLLVSAYYYIWHIQAIYYQRNMHFINITTALIHTPKQHDQQMVTDVIAGVDFSIPANMIRDVEKETKNGIEKNKLVSYHSEHNTLIIYVDDRNIGMQATAEARDIYPDNSSLSLPYIRVLACQLSSNDSIMLLDRKSARFRAYLLKYYNALIPSDTSYLEYDFMEDIDYTISKSGNRIICDWESKVSNKSGYIHYVGDSNDSIAIVRLMASMIHVVKDGVSAP